MRRGSIGARTLGRGTLVQWSSWATVEGRGEDARERCSGRTGLVLTRPSGGRRRNGEGKKENRAKELLGRVESAGPKG